MFWQKFTELCLQEGVSPNAVAKELSIPSGSITAWKRGVMPRNSTMQKIASHFNVSVGYLMGYEQKNSPPPEERGGLSAYDTGVLNWFHSLPPEKRQAILSLGDAPEALREGSDRERS